MRIKKYSGLFKFNKPLFQILVISVLTAGVYLNTLGNDFVWDDRTFILEWPLIKDLRYLPELLTSPLPFPHQDDYRPVKNVILLFNWQLFGANPFWYHIQAIAIHLSSTLLVWLITRRIIGKYNAPLVPLITGITFGVHPVHTEAITFIASSSDMLGVSLFLLSLYLYIKAMEYKTGRTRRLTFSLILSFLAYLTYEITLVLPFIFILYDWMVKRLSLRELLSRKKIYGLYFVALVFYGALRISLMGLAGKHALPENNLFITAITMVKVLFEYIKLVLFPLDLSVNRLIPDNIPALFYIDYQKQAFVSQKISNPSFLTAFIGVILVIAIAVFLYRKLPIVTFSVAWFFVCLIPVSNVILPLNNFMSERYTYLASFGYALFVGVMFAVLWNYLKHLQYARLAILSFFIVMTALFSFQTIIRNLEWKNAGSLWAKEVEYNSTSVIANHNLATAYFIDGKVDLARIHYETAYFNDQTNNSDVLLNLGYLYQTTGQPVLAIEKFRTALTNNPDSYLAAYRLAEAYRQMKNFSLSKEYYEKAIDLEPRFADAYIGFGLLYVVQNKNEEAVTQFQKAATLRPDLVGPWQNLGAAYIKMKKYEEAKDVLSKALKINPDNKQLQSMRESAERLKNIQKLIDKN